MTERAEALKADYLQSLKKIPPLVLAAFCCVLLLKAVAAVIASSTGKGSGFDEAVGLLFHYPESIRAIFAFFAAVIFFWAIPVLIYPSDLGGLLQRWVVVPSLHIVEHMLSLAVGVLLAWGVVDICTGAEDLSLKTVLKISFICAALGLFAMACSVLATFTTQEFEKTAQEIPRGFRVPLFLIVSLIVIGAVFLDFVWNYKPIAGAGH